MERRQFLRNLTVAGATIPSALKGAPAVARRKGPNDTIGVACIGVGTRGHQLLKEAQECSNTEVRIICDLYKPHVERARKLCTNANVRVVHEWEQAVADKDIDVVVIATPDFWHAPMTIRAAEAGKDIYCEKGWSRTLAEAKAMRKAVKQNEAILQLGHHYNSMPMFQKAREIYQSGVLGKVPLMRTYIDRTRPYPEWKFYGWYDLNELPKEATPQNIDWERFLGKMAPKRPFDPERFFRWRCFWDYGTGIAGDMLSHLWDCVNGIAGLGIPETAQTQGNLYFWKQDREVPDQWHVFFDYPKKDTAFTFECTFHNRHVGEVLQLLGREKTLEVAPHFCRTYLGEWKEEYKPLVADALKRAAANPELGMMAEELVAPDFSTFKTGDAYLTDHMQNFIDCVRSRQQPRCGVDRAFEEAAAIAMSMEAYRQKRQVRWDAAKEAIV